MPRTAGSTPSGSGIAAAAGTTDASAIVAIAQYDRTPRNAVSPSSRLCRYDGESGHSQIRPRRQERHTPHGIEPRQRNQLADPWRGHARPDRLHDAGALVTHHDRGRPVPLPVADVQVGMADAGREHPDADLARARLDQVELADLHRAADLGKDDGTDGGRHRPSIVAAWSHCPPVSAGPTATVPPRFFTFDVDAEAVMLADHPEVIDYLDVIGHQRYGPQVAVPRILRMLDRRGLRTTFFVPGWVAETWPDVIRSIRDAGHEIGHHGYMHESVRGEDEATEERLPGSRARGARRGRSASGRSAIDRRRAT